MKAPYVMTFEETIEYIVNNKCSVSRNGDGEIFLMRGKSIDFQNSDSRLSKIMRQALQEQNENFLPCIIRVFHKEYKPTQYYKNHLREYRYFWLKFTNPTIKYGDASITRFYSSPKDANKAKHSVKLLKKIWEGQSILIVEGEKSRLGIGNDLFDNAGSTKRILVPSIDAFRKYDEIKESIKSISKKDTLILLAIGPTATALAYELYKEGFWAIDIGHIDICYEWYLRGVERGVNVPGKYTNESNGGKCEGELSPASALLYQSQIVKKVL